MNIEDWWESLLECNRINGREDANKGIFETPHPNSDDPQDQDENLAYENGFKERRRELGDNFKWAGEK